VVLHPGVQEDRELASQILRELGYSEHYYKPGDTPEFHNLFTRLMSLVSGHLSGSPIDGLNMKEALEMFRTSFLVWNFPQFFRTDMTLGELQRMIVMVMDLYEKNDPCVRDVSLFLHMLRVLEEKLAKVGAEESEPIKEMLKVLRSKIIATFLQSFGHQTPISVLHHMFLMLMDLYDECEQRDDITPLFPEMLGILKERLELARTDEDEDGTDEDEDEVGTDEDGADEVGDGEDNIIRDMINILTSLMPKTHTHPFF